MRDYFARFGIYYIFRKLAAGKSVRKIEFFVELISADFNHVVTAGIEEQIVQMQTNGSFGGNFAGAQSPVKLDKSVRLRLSGILCNGRFDHRLVREEIEKRSVRSETERTQQNRRADFTLSVDVYPKNALGVLLEFKPRSAVGNNGSIVNLLTGLIPRRRVVRSGRTHQLRYDNALCAVYDKRSRIGHKREFAHKYALVDNFVLDLVDEPYFDVHGKGVRCVAVPALLLAVLGLFVEPVFEEIKLIVIGIVGYGHKVFEDFRNALLHKRVIARLLDFHEVGDLYNFVYFTEFSSFRFAILVNR